MSLPGACPDVSAYRELMRGRALPETEDLLSHLQTCQQCRRTIQALEDWLSNASLGGTPESDGRRRARQIASGLPEAIPVAAQAAVSAESMVPLPPGLLSAAQARDEVGRLGDYRIMGVLGWGGMGIVFDAENAGLGRVALKVLRPELAALPHHRERFLREARAMASVESDHVCPVFQVGEANGVPFIAMPLLEGESLDARLQRDSRLPLDEAQRIGREIALGLQAAHEMGLIHRDVKPANVWLEAVPSGPPRARLLDFGMVRGGDSNLTRLGDVMGTPAYQPLEQARGQRVDLRADLFSLGVILYEMLTGTRPYSGNDPASVLVSLTLETPAPPSLHRPEIPAELDDLILALLAKMPQDRPDRAEVVAERLAQLLVSTSAQACGQQRGWGRLAWMALIVALALGGLGAASAFFVRNNATVKPSREEERPREAIAEGEKLDREEMDRLARLDAYRKAMKEGRDAAALRKWAEAAAAYAAALKHKPDDPAAKAGLEAAQDELGRIAGEALKAKEEEAAFRRAMQKAQAAMKLRKYGEARQAFRDALAIRPSDPQARQGLDQAAALLTKQELQLWKAAEAEKFFREAENAYLGLTREVDHKKALELFEKAADKGHVVADGWVGWLTYQGKGTKKDEAKGAKLAQDATAAILARANDGDVDAQALLGALYTDGVGVPRDYQKALAWSQQAAKSNHAFATNNLGSLYEDGLGVIPDLNEAANLYRKAANKGHAAATFNLARLYAQGVNGEDVESAIPLYEKAADKGNASAAYALGKAYELGRGVTKDQKKAVGWYGKAANKGHAEATFALGLAYEAGRGVGKADLWTAVDWYKKAGDAGHAEAAYRVGKACETGRGADKDAESAAEWYHKAVKKGHAGAMSALGWMYEKGTGVDKDEKKAVELYQQAAAKDDPSGMFNLGRAYKAGLGDLAKSNKKAFEWFEKAAAKGDPGATNSLGVMYERGDFVHLDRTKAVKLYQQAADKGDPHAMFNLGRAYQNGRGGLAKSDKKAFDLFKEAADKGDPGAMNCLGVMYEQGTVVPRDEPKAVKLYQQAADKGDPFAMFNLGLAYQNGRGGLAKSDKKAFEWFDKAAKLGHTEAKRQLDTPRTMP